MALAQNMINTLDKFFSEKTINDVDRNTFLICNLNDPTNKLTISLVFMRNWHSIESDGYNSVIIQNKGAVFTFPCYWCSVPKELCMAYFTYILEDFYNTTVAEWNGTSGNNSDNGYGNGCNCPCGVV